MFVVARQAEQVCGGFVPVGRFQLRVTRQGERDVLLLRAELKADLAEEDRRKLTEDEIIELLQEGATGLIAGIEPLTERVFQSGNNLKVISRCGAGLDSVDLVAAKNHGITVFNTPEAPAHAVAELTMGLILTLLRQIRQIDQSVRKGEWPRTQGRLLAAQTVGIIGMGHIGRRVARLCQAFEAKVIAHDPYAGEIPTAVALMSLEPG